MLAVPASFFVRQNMVCALRFNVCSAAANRNRVMDDQSKLAYQDLRNLVEAGTFRMGERVQEAKLARELEYSRTPIRAALNYLEYEGFLTYEPNKGHIMSTFTPTDVEQIYLCRSLLEAEATYLAAKKGLSARTADKIQSLVQQMQRIVDQNDLASRAVCERYLRVNRKFHDTIYQACGNEHLLELIVHTSGLPRVIRNYYGFPAEAIESSQRDHVEMTRLLIGGDAARVRTRMRQHILKSCDFIVANPLAEAL